MPVLQLAIRLAWRRRQSAAQSVKFLAAIALSVGHAAACAHLEICNRPSETALFAFVLQKEFANFGHSDSRGHSQWLRKLGRIGESRRGRSRKASDFSICDDLEKAIALKLLHGSFSREALLAERWG